MKNTKSEIKALVVMLEKALETSSELWEDKKVSHAYIVGHLEGTIKTVIQILKP